MDNYPEITRPPRLSDKELMAIFPEAKEIIPLKLEEFQEQCDAIRLAIKRKLVVINSCPDEMSRWFWRQWLKLNEGEDLRVTISRIARLNRQLRAAQGVRAPKGVLTDDLIQAAREVPIESILNQLLRKAGRTLVGLCPFHTEHSPSFHVYPDENRAWCFGCNQGGDVIGIYMLLQDCGFKQAVLELSRGQR
jgi:hypothetical protein